MELTKKEQEVFKNLKKYAQVGIDVLMPYPLAFVRKLEALPDDQFDFSFDVAEGYGDGITDAIQDLREFIDHIDDVLHGLEYHKEREQEKEELKANPPVPTITFSNGDTSGFFMTKTNYKSRDTWTQ